MGNYKARFIRSHTVGNGSAKEAENESEIATGDSSDENVGIMSKRLIVSVVILLIFMYLSTGHRLFHYSLPGVLTDNPIIYLVLEIILSVAIIVINRHFVISGVRSVIKKAPNIDALISIGALSAFIYSAVISIRNLIYYGNMGEYIGESDIYFETCAMMLVLISVGKLIEEKAKGKTTDSINELSDMSPTTAIIKTPEGEKEVAIENVKVGDTFILKPGMRVPVDGIVVSGTSAVDESSLTGESIPVDKIVGSIISAATINISGYLTCKATGVGEDTVFSHIVQMVREASSGKESISKASDKISGYLIPAILVISIVTFICWIVSGMGFGFALSRAIAVLIISCPSALGLAAPAAVMVGSSIGARHGVLYKSAQALENTGLTQIVVVDKTGTITTGQPKVTDIISTADDVEHRDLLLTVAYSMEAKSEHPLAKAICDYAKKRFVEPLPTYDFVTIPGKGIRANIKLAGKEHTVYAGNEAYILEAVFGAKDPDAKIESDFTKVTGKLVASGKTPLLFATKNGLLGVIAVADEIRDNSIEAVEALHKENIHVVLVTGDRYETARAAGDAIGISRDEVLSEVLPQDKADIVNKLKQTGKVAMIGDGINDAPALSSADIGIAIGAGTDVAVDAADVVLIQDNLTSAVDAIRLSRLTLKIIRQNLFLTLSYILFGMPLAAGCFYKAFGWLLNPMFCAFAMSISSIIVILNAFRIFKFQGETE